MNSENFKVPVNEKSISPFSYDGDPQFSTGNRLDDD